MNIFLISRGYPNKKDNLWGNFEASQAEALRRLGHKVTVLVVDGRTRFYFRKIGIKHLKEQGVYIYHLFPFRFLLSERLIQKVNQWLTLRLFRKVASIEGRPDVIYAHYLNLMNSCLPIKSEFEGAFVGLEHWSALLKPEIDYNVDLTARRVYRRFDKILTVSKALRDSLHKHYGISATFMPNMVAEEFITATRNKKDWERFEFCAIGRLVSIKNFDILIKAAAILRDRGVDFGVRIIGSGPEESKLAKLISDLSLEGQVKLLGNKNREGIIENLNQSNVLVLPSDYETFGVVLIEAMAMGLPVIACNAGGPTDIVDNSNGILVPPRDTGALADAMQWMSENYEKFDNDKIAEDCASKYSSENVGKRIEKVLKEVVAKKKKKR